MNGFKLFKTNKEHDKLLTVITLKYEKMQETDHFMSDWLFTNESETQVTYLLGSVGTDGCSVC